MPEIDFCRASPKMVIDWGAPAHKRYERKVDEFCDKVGVVEELLVAALRLAHRLVRVIHGMKSHSTGIKPMP